MTKKYQITFNSQSQIDVFNNAIKFAFALKSGDAVKAFSIACREFNHELVRFVFERVQNQKKLYINHIQDDWHKNREHLNRDYHVLDNVVVNYDDANYLIRILDSYQRVRSGNVKQAIYFFCDGDFDHYESEEIIDASFERQMLITDYRKHHNLHNDIEVAIAYEMQCVIDHHISWQTAIDNGIAKEFDEPRNMNTIFVNFDPVVRYSQQPLIGIKTCS